MGQDKEPPAVLPSRADDEYECVLVDPQAALAPPGDAAEGEGLCPPGYVPRLKRRAEYRLRGKDMISGESREQNPQPPPAR